MKQEDDTFNEKYLEKNNNKILKLFTIIPLSEIIGKEQKKG